ncbi:hypothetical protein ABZ611_28000 [Streptomyces sp. NPDC007861]
MSTGRLGRAMIAVAAAGAPHRLLGTREINNAAILHAAVLP